MPRPPPGPAGPLAGFKRLRATAGQGPMLRWYGSSWEQDLRLCCPILRLCWSILGLCWPTLALCWPVLGPRLADLEAYVDPCWAKRPKNGNSKKNTVKRRIFWWSAAYLGAMWAHLGAVLAYLEGNVGLSWGYVGPSWGYVGLYWGQCGPILGLCWPILTAMLAHLEAMFANLEANMGPYGPILRHMLRKRGKNAARTRPAPGPADPCPDKGCRSLLPTPGLLILARRGR